MLRDYSVRSLASCSGRHTEEGARALVAGPSGLEAYRDIARGVASSSPPLLAPGGMLLLQLPGGEKGARELPSRHNSHDLKSRNATTKYCSLPVSPFAFSWRSQQWKGSRTWSVMPGSRWLGLKGTPGGCRGASSSALPDLKNLENGTATFFATALRPPHRQTNYIKLHQAMQ